MLGSVAQLFLKLLILSAVATSVLSYWYLLQLNTSVGNVHLRATIVEGWLRLETTDWSLGHFTVNGYPSATLLESWGDSFADIYDLYTSFVWNEKQPHSHTWLQAHFLLFFLPIAAWYGRRWKLARQLTP